MSEWKPVEGLIHRFGVSSLAQDPNRPDIVHVGADQGYWRIEEGRLRRIAAWDATKEGHAAIHDIIACPTAPRRLYGVADGVRVVLSDDAGVRWRRTAMRGQETIRTEFGTLVSDPSDADKLYRIVSDPFQLWHSADGGESWMRQEQGLNLKNNRFLGWRGNPLAVTRRGVKCLVLDDGGYARIAPGEDRWRLRRTPVSEPGDGCVYADPHHPSRLWRTAGGRLWRSDDGLRWTKLGPDAANFVVCDHGRPGRMALLRQYGRVSLSADAGRTWKRLSLPGRYLSHIAFAGDSLVALSHGAMLRHPI